jgi:predicted flap endonuclease-1-like 5' DNA nuclease
MLAVAFQIIFCLLVAAATGFAAGFLIRGIRRNAHVDELEQVWRARLVERDQELAAVQTMLKTNPLPTRTKDNDVENAEKPPENSSEDSANAMSSQQLSLAEQLFGEFTIVRAQLAETQAMLEKLAQSQDRLEAQLAASNSRPPPAPNEYAQASQPGLDLEHAPATLQGRDDLKLILGIGPALERTLNDLGVFTFRQVANWADDDIEQFAARLGSFGSRIKRDNWVQSAREQHRLKYGDAR